MKKTKCYLAALVSGVLLVTGILAGYGQSKKNDHLTVICTQNPGHIFMNQAEHMDAILYCTGGIHFVFA